MVEGSLGKGLDALIKKSSPKNKKEKKSTKTKQSTVIKDVKKPKQYSGSIKLDDKKIEEIKEEINKNPRISLWSAKSAAVLRYLKKTTPEFSISNEASLILEEAIHEKYPEIWDLFEDLS